MLTDADKAILSFERSNFSRPSGKAQAVRALFRCSMEEYDTALLAAVAKDGAAQYAPAVVAKVSEREETRSQLGERVSLFPA